MKDVGDRRIPLRMTINERCCNTIVAWYNQQDRRECKAPRARPSFISVREILASLATLMAAICVILSMHAIASMAAVEPESRSGQIRIKRTAKEISISQPNNSNYLVNNRFYGCWEQTSFAVMAGDQRRLSRICFSPNMTAYFVVITEAEGGDEIITWSIIDDASVMIDSQRCLVQVVNSEVLHLGDCTYAGVWFRRCLRVTEDGTGCLSGEVPNY
ncbi:MAG: hypothetical protein HC888_06945 [Candidatus Competibacteraceae bacterium]|nr:hypothetical protein [Candidatus Competibacteraceae bacterium]